MSTKSRSGEKKGKSLDRQITAQDLDCLREAFALFDVERTEEITTEELGKVTKDHADALCALCNINPPLLSSKSSR